MFIGREREVAALDRSDQSNKFEFAVIYGGETCRKDSTYKSLYR